MFSVSNVLFLVLVVGGEGRVIWDSRRSESWFLYILILGLCCFAVVVEFEHRV